MDPVPLLTAGEPIRPPYALSVVEDVHGEPCIIMSGEGEIVARFPATDRGRATAAFVAKVCWLYEDMLAACIEAKGDLAWIEDDDPKHELSDYESLPLLDAVLAKVRSA